MKFNQDQLKILEIAAQNKDAECIAGMYKSLAEGMLKNKKHYNNYDDLVQEIVLASLMALKSFDPKKGSFVSWCSYYLKTRYNRAKMQIHVIRIPERMLSIIDTPKITYIDQDPYLYEVLLSKQMYPNWKPSLRGDE